MVDTIVKHQKEAGYDWVKVYSRLRPAAFGATIVSRGERTMADFMPRLDRIAAAKVAQKTLKVGVGLKQKPAGTWPAHARCPGLADAAERGIARSARRSPTRSSFRQSLANRETDGSIRKGVVTLAVHV